MKNLVFLIISLTVLTLPGFAQTQRIKSVHFHGNKILESSELLGQMNTLPKKSLEKIIFWKKRPDFIKTTLDEDMNRLVSYFNRNGFLDPVISYKLDSSRSERLVTIDINIKENEFVKIGNVEINQEPTPNPSGQGNQEEGNQKTLLDSLERVMALKSGERFRDDDVFKTETMLKKTFSDHGYPFTTVKRRITLDDDGKMADITFDLNPGDRSFFGNISVRGDSLITEKFIRKYLLFSQGELYKQNKIDSTQQDIFGTDLFQYVVIASKKDSVQGDRIPVEIIVKELPRWKLETGIGYGTEDKLRLAFELTKLNFLGGARRLIINGKTSYFLPFSVDMRFIQPDFLFTRLDLILNPFYLREREISYTIDRMGGGIRLVYRFRNNLSTHFSYSFERDRLLELSDLQLNPSELKHNKSIFTIGGELNTSDDLFYPSRGHRIQADASLAGLGFEGKVNYYKLNMSYIRYISFSKDVILATRLSGGVLQTIGTDENTPIEERFYLGGASSLRGWGRHRISPPGENGLLLGGNTMTEGSAELRFPIYDILHGALFIDAGNVWYKSYSMDLSSLHYDAGAGLRIRTPIGPVRLDLATPVINDGFNLQFFISVGHAF